MKLTPAAVVAILAALQSSEAMFHRLPRTDSPPVVRDGRNSTPEPIRARSPSPVRDALRRARDSQPFRRSRHVDDLPPTEEQERGRSRTRNDVHPAAASDPSRSPSPFRRAVNAVRGRSRTQPEALQESHQQTATSGRSRRVYEAVRSAARSVSPQRVREKLSSWAGSIRSAPGPERQRPTRAVVEQQPHSDTAVNTVDDLMHSRRQIQALYEQTQRALDRRDIQVSMLVNRMLEQMDQMERLGADEETRARFSAVLSRVASLGRSNSAVTPPVQEATAQHSANGLAGEPSPIVPRGGLPVHSSSQVASTSRHPDGFEAPVVWYSPRMITKQQEKTPEVSSQPEQSKTDRQVNFADEQEPEVTQKQEDAAVDGTPSDTNQEESAINYIDLQAISRQPLSLEEKMKVFLDGQQQETQHQVQAAASATETFPSSERQKRLVEQARREQAQSQHPGIQPVSAEHAAELEAFRQQYRMKQAALKKQKQQAERLPQISEFPSTDRQKRLVEETRQMMPESSQRTEATSHTGAGPSSSSPRSQRDSSINSGHLTPPRRRPLPSHPTQRNQSPSRMREPVALAVDAELSDSVLKHAHRLVNGVSLLPSDFNEAHGIDSDSEMGHF